MACSTRRSGPTSRTGAASPSLQGAGPAAAAKAAAVTWEQAASYGLTYFTAYRMLIDQAQIKAGDNVPGLGRGRRSGHLRRAAVQAGRRQRHRRGLLRRQDLPGARAGGGRVVHRREFALSDPTYGQRIFDETKRFGKAIREADRGRGPPRRLRARGTHVRDQRLRVQAFGTIVICGATSGFNLDFDVRYLWMRQKRIIGSHFADAYECNRANRLIIEGKIEPVLSRVFPFAECPSRTR